MFIQYPVLVQQRSRKNIFKLKMSFINPNEDHNLDQKLTKYLLKMKLELNCVEEKN